MTIKRVILALLVVTMAIAPVAHAENVPACADEHLTGADCQGPDIDSSANGCKIKVWVGKATCDLIVPDGAASVAGIGAGAWADQGTAPEMDIVVRDKATGTVLYQSHHTNDPAAVDPSKITAAVDRVVDDVAQGRTGSLVFDLQYGISGSAERQFVRNTNASIGTSLSPQGGAEVTCEVTGTHSQLGAATAAAGDTPDVDLFGQASLGLQQHYNNDFSCVVDEGQSDPPPISPGAHGCVAEYPKPPNPTGYLPFGSSCSFIGEPSGVPSGAVSATTGTYTVSHQGPSGTVVDISGSGLGAMPFVFTQGVWYTLTVNGDGTGAVTAGSPE